MKILVTGSNGQLGSEVKKISTANLNDQYTFVDLAEMDLASDEAIQNYFRANTFDFVINCAAYTAVDRAEEDVALAYRVNAESVKTIATICLERKIRLIHISTDYVFDGNGNRPINEDDEPNPISVYGKSKLEGERYVRSILPDAYVIRTAWVYSAFGKNFVKTISKYAREREQLTVVYDQVGSPTYAYDLALTIIAIIEKIKQGVDHPGVYHFSNEGVISWYDFAWFIVKHYGLKCRILPIPASEYKTAATRPVFSVLDKSKIKRVFGINIPHWYDSLEVCLKELKDIGQ